MTYRFPLVLLVWLLAAASAAAQPAPAKTEPAAAAANNPAADLPRPKVKPVPPRSQPAIEAAIGRGVAFLLADQNKNGSWGSAEKTKESDLYAPIPGAHQAFRAAVTALCVTALLEAGESDPKVKASVDRAQTWLLANLPRVRRATPDALYNVWTHAYGIEAMAKLHARASGNAALQAQLVDVARSQVTLLDRYETVDGGWGYYDFAVRSQRPAGEPTSFTTATVLLALDRARLLGIELPPRLAKRGLATMGRQRKGDFTYVYSEQWKYAPMGFINRQAASLGRSQACNLALRTWGDARVTDAVLSMCLDRLWARHLWIELARKRPIPHESYFDVAGYFFYYGHYYAALCIEQLPAAERERHRDQLAFFLVKLQEKDGSWWDYPLYNYHQQYGTAFAISSLVRCRAEKGVR